MFTVSDERVFFVAARQGLVPGPLPFVRATSGLALS
jgi:hypothetical protein